MIDGSTNTNAKTKKQILDKENGKKNNRNYDSDFSDYTTKETTTNKKKYDSASSRSPTPGIFCKIKK